MKKYKPDKTKNSIRRQQRGNIENQSVLRSNIQLFPTGLTVAWLREDDQLYVSLPGSW